MSKFSIPSTITVPVTGTKMDTKQVFLWIVIIIGAYLLITKGIPAIISAISSGVKKGMNDLADVTSGTAQGTPQYQSAGLWNNAYLDNMGKNDPFGTGLYPQHAAQSNLDYPTLVSIAKAARSAMGTGIFGIHISGGNEADFENAFAPCLTQTDVSNVAVVYGELYKSSSLAHDAIRDPILCVNLPDYNDNGDIMAVDLQKFIQKVNKLPVA